MSKVSPSNIYPEKVNLNNCDREPIHLIGKVQNHGILLSGLVNSKKITRCSVNCDRIFNENATSLLNNTLLDLLPISIIEQLFNGLEADNSNFISTVINQLDVDLIIHLNGEEFILEIEEVETRVDSLIQQSNLTKTVSTINNITNPNTLNDFMADVIKTHLGYDRVMIYQFDHQWNGSVVAEKKEDHLESWLGLHYPSTDIPVPARRLFYNENSRLIKDVNADSVPIVFNSDLVTNKEIDLSRSEIRATSPIHIEYLRNMGVNATLTMPIVSGKIVWGLIGCHHYSAKAINYSERLSLKFLTQFFASKIQINKSDKVLKTIKASSFIRGELINQIIESWNISDGLTKNKYTLQDLTESSGASICMGEKITRIGKCPSETQIFAIIKRIKEITNESFYETNNSITDFPNDPKLKLTAAGIICVFISDSREEALLWFKPEVKETVYWGGKPQEKSADKNLRLSPRKSFDKWKEISDGFSTPWQENEIAVVKEFRKNVSNFVVQKYDEVKLLNVKLKEAYKELESFSYSVSHDLRAPLRGIDGFAQIIKEDYFDSLDDFGKSSIETIISSVQKMDTLIDDILSFSGLDQRKVQYKKFSIHSIFQNNIDALSKQYPNAKIILGESFPEVYGDPSVVKLLIKNLLENALKYSSKEERPVVQIGVDEKNTFYIQDNGIGFDQKNSENIFRVFRRLNNSFEGSGIGLSIAKRVIDKHNGKIWANSEKGKGATFYFNFNQKEENPIYTEVV